MTSILPLFLFLLFNFITISQSSHHTISIPPTSNLSPKSLIFHPKTHHFILSSSPPCSLHTLPLTSRGDVTLKALLPELPANSTITSLSLHPLNSSLLSSLISPNSNSLSSSRAAPSILAFLHLPEDGKNARLLSLCPLPGPGSSSTTDYKGNTFVTDRSDSVVYKVTPDGHASIFSSSFAYRPKNPDGSSSGYSNSAGLSAIVHMRTGFLIVFGKGSGKVFRVDEEDGKGKEVLMSNGDLRGVFGSVVRRDGSIVAISKKKGWIVNGRDGWTEGSVIDEMEWEKDDKRAIGVTLRDGDKVYVLFEKVVGGSGEFCVEEVVFPGEERGEVIWPFLLLGLGLCYAFWWRFQIGELTKSMNKKRS